MRSKQKSRPITLMGTRSVSTGPPTLYLNGRRLYFGCPLGPSRVCRPRSTGELNAKGKGAAPSQRPVGNSRPTKMNRTQPVPEHSRPWVYYLAALLSLGGLADSIYLTVTHLTGENVVCVASSGRWRRSRAHMPVWEEFRSERSACWDTSRPSAWQRWPRSGMHVPGRFWPWSSPACWLTTLWLLYVQAFVLHAFCDFCLLSAGLTFALAAIVTADHLTGRKHRAAVERGPLLEL